MRTKLIKNYRVYYHRRGEKKGGFNQMGISLDAKNAKDAVKKAKIKLGKNWTVESARFDFNY